VPWIYSDLRTASRFELCGTDVVYLSRVSIAGPEKSRGYSATCIQGPTDAAYEWWTGEDSNLRSPQGAADLQSAGFSHSPTRPHGKPPIGIERILYIRGETPVRSCYSHKKQIVILLSEIRRPNTATIPRSAGGGI
jgi:hypothetical protein